MPIILMIRPMNDNEINPKQIETIDISMYVVLNYNQLSIYPQTIFIKFKLRQSDKTKQMEKHHDQDFYGINKKLYKKSKPDEFTFKRYMYISDNVFLPTQPQLSAPNDTYQTVHLPKHNILEDSLRRQVESIVFAQTFINQIVYDSKDPSPYTKDADPSQYDIDVMPYYLPKSKEDTVLVFQSRFQCGNLRRVIQKSDYQYNLVLATDYNTNGHTQWYFFSVANTRKNVQYRINIINLLKPDSLYNVGMKPLVYSQKNALSKGVGWLRDGGQICYYTNNMKRKYGGYYSSLSFTLKFQHDCDTVYIAHCYPYTYTRLLKFLKGLESDPTKKHRFQRKFLSLTQSGNNNDYLIIGDSNNKQKKAIILTSRVHPGETMSSYIIQYIIEFLLGNSSTARNLRENFVFKIVPMLNPDGVIVGNYRCNLSGADLNRQWIEPSKKAHPTIYYTKQLIRSTKAERELGFCTDIHGHNRKKNIFIYGCASKDGSKRQQIFPMLMHKNCPVFQFKDCCFQVQKDREGAARIALWKDLNITNCFTLQLSFCGSDFGRYEFYHFNINIYKDISHAFCQSLEDYYESSQTKVKKAMEELEHFARNPKVDDSGKNSQDSDYSGDENEIVPGNKEKQGRDSREKRSVEGRQARDNTNDKNAVSKPRKLPMGPKGASKGKK